MNYIVKPTAERPPFAGQVEGTPWQQASSLHIDQFPWYQGGLKQATQVRLLYDAHSLYLRFLCEDRHIWAQARELNGPVHLDSCVEFFASPAPMQVPDYFNVEVNCCGALHLGFGPGRPGRKKISPELARRIRIATSVPGPAKEESPDDASWWVCCELPFDVLSEFIGRPVEPARGTIWRANFYRCGGKTDPQYACWRPTGTPEPDYHRPEAFGEILFG